MKQNAKYIRWFEEIKIGDIPTFGCKNVSHVKCIPVGFAGTAEV